jgi:hypothetical protein
MYPEKKSKKIGMIIMVVLSILAVLSAVIMLLWNALLPDILHLPAINYWQAMGLLILSKLLFGGFRGWGGGGKHWKKELRDKWMQMPPDEREKLRQEWRDRCRMWPKKEEQSGAGTE